MSTVEWDDRGFKESLTKALSTMKLKSDAEAEVLAYLIANGAKQRAPVKTGRLRASIGVQAGEDAKGKFFDVGTYLNYAPYLEFGDSIHLATSLHARLDPGSDPELASADNAVGAML